MMNHSLPENRYGKDELDKIVEKRKGYYFYEIYIYNKELQSKLNLNGSNLDYHLYNLLNIEEIESIFGYHWTQEHDRIDKLYGKIYVCDIQDIYSKFVEFYQVIVCKLESMGFELGSDYKFIELRYVKFVFGGSNEYIYVINNSKSFDTRITDTGTNRSYSDLAHEELMQRRKKKEEI